MQYILFNAMKVKYEVILKFLRKIAECWQEDKQQSRRLLDIINKFKKQTQNYETFQHMWQNLAEADTLALTRLQKNFLEMLTRNG